MFALPRVTLGGVFFGGGEFFLYVYSRRFSRIYRLVNCESRIDDSLHSGVQKNFTRVTEAKSTRSVGPYRVFCKNTKTVVIGVDFTFFFAKSQNRNWDKIVGDGLLQSNFSTKLKERKTNEKYYHYGASWSSRSFR